MSHCGLKSPYLGLLPDEENEKCGIANALLCDRRRKI